MVTTATHLSLPLELSYDDYEMIGALIGTIRDTSNWWLGEWLLQGERLYGDKIYQACEATRRSPQTLTNIASVCRRIPKSVRRERVTFSAHAEVASLTPNEQRRWLKIADERNLSTSELRFEINAYKLNGSEVHPAEVPICESCGRPL